MKAAPARVGARGTDSVQAIDAAHAKALKAAGIDFCERYLGSLTRAELDAITGAGLACMVVTFADQFDGHASAAQCDALGLPKGCTVFLDVEGQAAWKMDPVVLAGKINAWADAIKAAGFEPGIYVGVPQPLTSDELFNLRVVRYWRGIGRVTDRHGNLSEPTCGYCMHQCNDSQMVAGVWADFDFIEKDYSGRLPTWVVK